MRVWRICRKAYLAFDGEGARLYGGRWNPVGLPVIYTAGSLSLAALEYFVNIPSDLIPDDLVKIPVVLPDALKLDRVNAADLPGDWYIHPAPVLLQRIGADWLKAASTAVLAVPSAIVPEETNYLLNPAHKDFKRIKIHTPEPFGFDARMWKKT